MNQSFFRRCGLAASAVMAAGSTAQAVVSSVEANVTAEVREVAGGAVLNSDLALDQLDVTTHNLPLVALARLLPPTGESTAQEGVVAEAMTQFSDPRLSVSTPPNEFSLDTLGFSNSATSSASGHCLAVEMRQVVFQPDEVNLASGTAVTAESHFFLDGLMVLMARPGQPDLTGTRAELTIRVIQERAGSDPATVLEATVVLTGNSDGTASLQAGGALTADNLTTFGLNPPDSSQGTLQAVVLPNLAIPYTYPANIGETFGLRAEVEARFASPPGLGAGVVLGDRLNDLAAVLEQVFGQDLASNFTTSLTVGLSSAPLALKPLVAAEQDTILTPASDSGLGIPLLGGISCGPLGLEPALLVAGLAALGVTARRKM
jgi:hypothetical protein